MERFLCVFFYSYVCWKENNPFQNRERKHNSEVKGFLSKLLQTTAGISFSGERRNSAGVEGGLWRKVWKSSFSQSVSRSQQIVKQSVQLHWRFIQLTCFSALPVSWLNGGAADKLCHLEKKATEKAWKLKPSLSWRSCCFPTTVSKLLVSVKYKKEAGYQSRTTKILCFCFPQKAPKFLVLVYPSVLPGLLKLKS